jgi:hypothetical protein
VGNPKKHKPLAGKSDSRGLVLNFCGTDPEKGPILLKIYYKKEGVL